MKKYLLGAFLVVAINLFGARISKLSDEIAGLKNLVNYNEIKDTPLPFGNAVSYDATVTEDDKIYLVRGDKLLFTGAVVKREKGDIVEISFVKDGLKEGLSYSYYLNGDLKKISTYRNGKIEGTQILFRPNGKLESEQVFENNFLVSDKIYDKNGLITKEYKFYDSKNGILKKYYKDTEKLAFTSTVKTATEKLNNEENIFYIFDGETKVFREDGTLMSILKYKDGSLENVLQEFYYPNGKRQYYLIVVNEDAKNFKIRDRIISYYPNGRVKDDCIQQRDGSWTYQIYGENGKFIDEGRMGVDPVSKGSPTFWENILNPVFDVLSK